MINKSTIFKSLNIKQEEEKIFSYLFFHSFSLGLFIALYFLSANSLFIAHFETEDLPLAYIFAGGVGYIVSMIYTYLQSRVPSRNLFLYTVIFLAFIPIASRILLIFFPEKWMSFFTFIWAWPFISLVSTESGGLALQKLDLRQVKRLYSLVNIGGVSASILSYLSVPLLLELLPTAFDLLTLSSVGAIAGAVILIKIYRHFPDKQQKQTTEEIKENKHKTGFRQIFENKYLALLFMSAFFSILTIYLVDFGFLSAVKVQKEFFSDAKTVSSFFAYVFSGLKIIELVTSVYSGRWLAKYGIKFGLAALPVTMFLLMLIAAASGFTWGAASITLFVVLVVSKAAERFIRRSLEDPAFNVLYQPLPEEQQLMVQTRVGVVVQFSVGIAGIILLGVNFFLNTSTGFRLEMFPLLLLPLFTIWLYVAFLLYKHYRGILRQILLDKSKEMTKNSYRHRYGDETLRRKLKPFTKSTTRLAAIILSESDSRQLYRYSVSLLSENDEIVSPAVLRHCTPSFPQKILKVLSKVSTEELPLEAQENIRWVQICVQGDEFVPESGKEKALRTLKNIANESQEDAKEIIAMYMTHSDMQIQKTAIEIAGGMQDATVATALVRLLEKVNIRNYVANILAENSQDVLDDLEKLFWKSNDKSLLLKIIEIWAKIGTAHARELLLKKIDYLDRDVQIAAIKALHFCRYTAEEQEQIKVIQKIEQVIASILWVRVCMDEMEEQVNVLKLQQSLELDLKESYNLLFNLLSFLYAPTTIELIKKNIMGENTIFALEIIENFMSPEIKSLIVPLFENISIGQKLKRLERITNVQKMSFQNRLREIVISDFHILNDWTRAKAIELIGRRHKKKTNEENAGSESDSNEIKLWTSDGVKRVLSKIKKSEMPDEIFVSMYHPNELVYSTAAKIIYDESPSRCFSYIKTLSNEKQFLTEVFLSPEKMLITERLKYIKRHLLFFNIPERTLIHIAKVLQPMHLQAGETLDLAYEHLKDKILIVINGTIEAADESLEKVFKKNDVVLCGINLPVRASKLFVKRKAFVFYGDRSEYFNLLMDDTEIVHHMIDEV